MMKPIPAVLVCVASGFVGWMLAQGPIEDYRIQVQTEAEESNQKPSEELIREISFNYTMEHGTPLVESLPDPSEASKAQAMGEIAAQHSKVTEVDKIFEETLDTFESAKKILTSNNNPGERLVSSATVAMLKDDLVMGKGLIQSEVASIRIRGLQALQRAAAKGNAEAIEVLMMSLEDSDKTFSSSALNSLTRLPSKTNVELNALLEESGVVARFVNMLPSLEGRDRSRVLSALTTLKNPVAVQFWRQDFAAASGTDRKRIDAARALAGLDSPGEAMQISSELGTELRSGERNRVRGAIRNLTRLGGKDAKTMLQSALDSDPEGDNAGRIKRAIRNIDRRASSTENTSNRRGTWGGLGR